MPPDAWTDATIKPKEKREEVTKIESLRPGKYEIIIHWSILVDANNVKFISKPPLYIEILEER